ncbi:MAG: energy transducer TonB [Candidatus Cyclobacteriaceae bacterium M2_1C_046]
MEPKKTEKADLNKRKGLFFNIGLLASLLIVTAAFEYRQYDEGDLVELSAINDDFEELTDIPPTEQPPPPPPKIQQPEIVEVPDEEEIEEEIEVDMDVDITEETVIEEVIIEEAPEEEVADEIFQIVEDPATPKGGYEAFYEYVGNNMRYPAQARRMGIEGTVYVQFVVEKDGSITDVQAVRGIGAGCDEEAVRVIKAQPNWNPPKQRGKPVRQRIILPIKFQLG